nr:UbiA family prenyltransferase [Ardenticatenales bacterium]
MTVLRHPLVWLELARAHSALGAALAVWVGGRVAGAAWSPAWAMPMLVAFLLSAAGNAFNDGHDAPIDQINRPGRPIPRGAATPLEARCLAYGAGALALLLALPLGLGSTLGTLLGLALLFGYTLRLRAIPLLGNAVVGVLTGMALGYGGLLAGNVPVILLPAATLGLFFGGREVLKTLHDVPGDQANGLRTIATVAGPRRTLLVATLCFGAALLLLALWA